MGDRFAALEPISQGVREQFGSVEADAGRRLSLGMDHGSQYRSDDFRAQLKFWGITPSYALVAEPQPNGVAERFNRTMKEQAIHGRLFNHVEEVRAVAVAFKERYNREWRLEKLASRHPSKPVRHRSCRLPPDRKIVSKQPNPVHPSPWSRLFRCLRLTVRRES
ncbi:MAG: integrase core domain-containing protein [Burkholderia sp.]